MCICTLKSCMSPISRCWTAKYPEAQLSPQGLDCRVHKDRWPGLAPWDLKSLSTRFTTINFLFIFPLSVIELYSCELCLPGNMVILALYVARKTKVTAVQLNHCNWFVRSNKIDICPSNGAVSYLEIFWNISEKNPKTLPYKLLLPWIVGKVVDWIKILQ